MVCKRLLPVDPGSMKNNKFLADILFYNSSRPRNLYLLPVDTVNIGTKQKEKVKAAKVSIFSLKKKGRNDENLRRMRIGVRDLLMKELVEVGRETLAAFDWFGLDCPLWYFYYCPKERLSQENKFGKILPMEQGEKEKFSRRKFLEGLLGAAAAFGGASRLFPARAEVRPQETYPYSPSEILYFNPQKDSGWFYAASTVPDENGIAFWVAGVRSLSKEQTDPTANLLYGITDPKAGKYYPGLPQNGTFSENPTKVNLSFSSQSGQELLKFQQTKDTLEEFQLTVNLPWLEGQSYQTTKTLPLNRPFIYESGDGVVPLGGGIDSLYASLALERGVWTDFQKFNLAGFPTSGENKAALQSSRGFFQSETIGYSQPNHRWGCFMLNENVGNLPLGTVGVWWEILDKQNQRQPGGFTNIDLLVPGRPQLTKEDFQIETIGTWESEASHKLYLREWRLKQPELGVDLRFKTIFPDQENSVLGGYFYEGSTQVYDPQNPEKQVGTGMLEQTHSEPRKVFLPSLNK